MTTAAGRLRDSWFVVLLGTIYLCNFVDRTIVAVLGEPIRHDLGLSDLQFGIMGGFAFSFFYAILGVPLARVAERRNRIALITIVTILWSIATMLCGAATSFSMLLLCRIGVGIGEAGFTPALVSMISDRFEEHRRPAIFSLISVGVPIGGAVAAIGGGWLSQTIGWRHTFVAVGLPGLFLALLLWATITEPPRREGGAVADTPKFGAVLRRLAASPTYLYLTCGGGFVALVGFGLNLYLIPYLVRSYQLPVATAGLAFAVGVSIAVFVGTAVGGLVMTGLQRRDPRWCGWAPACSVALALPLYWLALLQSDWRWLMVLLFLANGFLYAFLPAIMAVTQSLVEPRMRATAAAIHSLAQTVGGLGIGSVILGFLSDTIAARLYTGPYKLDCIQPVAAKIGLCRDASAGGLRWSLMLGGVALFVAIWAYLKAASTLHRDRSRAWKSDPERGAEAA